MKRFFYLLFFVFCGCLYAGPLLIYNQYPRVWNMDFKEMTKYIPKIKQLRFNVVWVNPFFQCSDEGVERVNKFTGEVLKVKGSLYAMKLDQNGKPEMNDPEDPENIKKYTEAIKMQGMIPIFDLVLNHIAKDSTLVQKKPEWFKKPDSHWDDICPFNYTEGNREEIFNTIWAPLLDQMKDLGFQGMRVDYGTDVDQATLKMCVSHLNKIIVEPLIVFGEALIPPTKTVNRVLESCRDSGFTHLTNLSIFLSKQQISSGKNNGYQWFLNDLGLKKLTCSGKCSGFWTGTVGFSGSHDHGTTILSYFLNQEITHEDIENRLVAEGMQEDEDWEKQEKYVRGKLIQERLNSKTQDQKLEIMKERMAIAAFSSDAGWYCFSSDEWMSEISKSPFVRSDGSPFHKEENIPENSDSKSEIESFIENINSAFLRLREASGIFWVEMFYSNGYLIFVRHIYKDQLPADIVCVKIEKSANDYTSKNIMGLLSGIHAELHSFEESVNIYILK